MMYGETLLRCFCASPGETIAISAIIGERLSPLTGEFITYFLGRRSGMGAFLMRDGRAGTSGGEDGRGFLGWVRETFSLIRDICEWTAWRDCFSLRAISDGLSLLARKRQIVSCFSVRSIAGCSSAV